MMMEFVIPFDKREILAKSSDHVRSLFNVQVVLQPEAASGKQWVKINGEQGVQKAREYIEAICSPEMTKTLPKMAGKSIKLDTIAKNYSVVAAAENGNITLSGSQVNVVLAKTWIEKENECLSTSAATCASSMDDCRKFAIKLGYSDSIIDEVIKAIGPGPVDTNTFLRELVRRNKRTNVSSKTEPRRKSPDIVPRGIAARGMPATNSQVGEFELRTTRTVIEAPRYEATQSDSAACRNGDMCPIIIDGSNIAMHHGNHKVFSCRGIALCVEWFQKRGHAEVFALVPRYRAEPPRPGYPIKDQQLLMELYNQGVVRFTPSRRRDDSKDIVCYDDRFILELAYKIDGVIVSNDEYRDLKHENSGWKEIIEKRVLMFSFVRDIFMVPDDPLGRKGPTLNEFLKRGSTIAHPKICPWLGHCTFGSKCRFYHPEKQRGETVQDNVQMNQQYGQQHTKTQERNHNHYHYHQHSPQEPQYYHNHNHYQNHQYIEYEQHNTGNWSTTYSMPTQFSYTPPNSFGYNNSGCSNHDMLLTQLEEIFPNQRERIARLLDDNPQIETIDETLIDKLLAL